MALSLSPHVYEKINGQNNYRLTRIDPYIRLGFEGNYVFIQGGRIMDPAGVELKEIPAWVKEQIAMMTPAARAEVGLIAQSEKKVN